MRLQSSAAESPAGVGELPAGHRNEFPDVASRVQRQLQDAGRSGVASLTVGSDALEPAQLFSTGPYHELSDAPRRVCLAIRILSPESLVVVVVSGDDHVRPGRVERLPERLYDGGTAMLARAEERMVKVCQGAFPGVGLQVGLQPPDLPGGGAAATDLLAIAVQSHYVPPAAIVAVVSSVGPAGGRAKVVEVPGRTRRIVIVVAGSRLSAGFVASPRRAVTVEELAPSATFVGVVSDGEYRPGAPGRDQCAP